MTPERRVPDRDAAGQLQEFRAGGIDILGAATFTHPQRGDVVVLVVPDKGVLDEIFALRAAENPELFERSWGCSSRWMVLHLDDELWARLEVEVVSPRRALARLLMNVKALRSPLEMVARGSEVDLVRESVMRDGSAVAMVESSLTVFAGGSNALGSALSR